MDQNTIKVRAGIVGGAGYTGGELIRLLIRHPNVSVSYIHSKSNAGKPLHVVHADLLGDTDLLFAESFHHDIDVLFLCMGHGEAKKFLEANPFPKPIKIIDLSNDFRLEKDSVFSYTRNQKPETRNFIYGLPELNRETIRTADSIANPGCFATSIQLGLLPLAKAGLLDDVYTTGITGSTGAGQNPSATTHFSWRANNISAYKTLTHQHLGEITQSINQLQTETPLGINGSGPGIRFVPWRGDFTRGIFISSTIDCGLPVEEIKKLFIDFYQDHPFTHYSETMIDMKQVVNTNKCLIHVEKVGSDLVIHSTTDNLLKGASGQAIQNMNLMFGLEETTGLQLKASYF